MSKLLFLALLAFFALALLQNAWMVDDAYITLRSVDNFVNGLGPTWNPSERVQVYTHPLWMLLVSLVYAITSETFFTVVALSFVVSMAAVLVAAMALGDHPRSASRRVDTARAGLLLLALLSSKAFVDYASSGLENPLSYLLGAAFLAGFLRVTPADPPGPKRVGALVLLASLAFVNRADTLVLFAPALAYILWLARGESKRRLALAVLAATLPAVAWLLFSLVYYGYPFPNTAYAKVLATDFPVDWKVRRGLEHVANGIRWDGASFALAAGAGVVAWRRRSAPAALVLAGVALYLCYVVVSAASATHMSGRFFAVPFFLAIVLFARGVPRGWIPFVALALAAFVVWSPVSAPKFGTRLYRAYEQNESFIDAKWFVWREGAALLNWRPGKRMPDHDWYHYGETIRGCPQKVHVGGAYRGEPIGYAGFAAGPEQHLVDRVGLSDPLLSRLPALRSPDGEWKSGHFHRRIPDGYLASVETGENRLVDPALAAYYEAVRTITRGPIFRGHRLAVIARMNAGAYEHLLR